VDMGVRFLFGVATRLSVRPIPFILFLAQRLICTERRNVEMLLTKEVEVGLKGNKRIPYYREKGYIIPTKIDKYKRTVIDYSKTLTVKTEDMPIYSEAKVTVKCDYQEEGCRDVYEKNVGDYIKNNINSVVHTDCCANRKCQTKKTAECNLINYGFKYHINQPEFMEKMKRTNLEKYNSEVLFGSDYFINKTKEVVKEKYGVDNISQIESVKLKKSETFFRNGSTRTSRQQIYIHQLFGGELNYSNNTPSLDIAFPEDKVYIEVNGSGHDLCVKMGNMTEKEFKEREKRRYYYLKRRGWKVIFINTVRDYLPSNEVLLEEFNKALEWFESNDKGHYHYNINIGGFINDDIYGKLRIITEKDLKVVS